MQQFFVIVNGEIVAKVYGESEDKIYEDYIQILNEEEYKEFKETK